MTRIAVMADIHGNLPALQAIMADLQTVAPDRVIVAGDVINRGPQSKACLQTVRAAGWPIIFGNHEEYVLKAGAGELPAEWYTDWWLPTRTVAAELSDEETAYLRVLPWFEVVDVPGLPPIRVVHGSPRFLNEGLGFWMTDAELSEAWGDARESIVIGAHTHRPFDRRVDTQNNGHVASRWALNCGAVGAPFNGNPAAQYLLLSGQRGEWVADFRAVPYDRTPVYEAWEQSGLLERSMVAHVFKYEVETATFHLLAYERFCQLNNLEKNELASFERYRTHSTDVVPGRSLKNVPFHPINRS